MNILQRYSRLGFWTKLSVWGSLASLVGLLIAVWPATSGSVAQGEASGTKVVQTVSDSPNSVNLAAQTIIVGKPPPSADEVRRSLRDLLHQISPKILAAADAGTPSVLAVISKTRLSEFQKLAELGPVSDYCAIIVHGPGPTIIDDGSNNYNFGDGVILDVLHDGLLMNCTILFAPAIRNAPTMPSSVPLTRGTPPAGQEPRHGSRSAHG